MTKLKMTISYYGYRIKGDVNCSDLIAFQLVPALPDVLKETGGLGVILITVAGFITAMNTLIYIDETIRLYKKWPLEIYCYKLAALAVFPIASLCFLLTILMPPAHDVNTTTATLYQPLSLVLFYKLVISYFGGEDRLKASLQGKKIPLKGPPFYFLCRWCPTTYMSIKLYYLMKVSIYQLFLAPCFLYFVMGVCSKTGVYISGQFSFENAHMYIMVLGGISFCIGIYALVIFYKMAQLNLPGYFIRGKYYVLQTFFVLTRLHVIIFDTLGNNHYLPCFPPISAFTSGLYMRSALLIGFSFILSTVARYIFLQDPPIEELNLITAAITDTDDGKI